MLTTVLKVPAQSCFPDSIGQKMKYNAMIEKGKGYVSGICIMVNEGEEVKASLFNEFGISALDFVYYPQMKKVKMLNVISFLNKWYIKKVLRKDLLQLIYKLQAGEGEYNDTRYKIKYKLERTSDYDTEE